ncbi:MAG: SUMF1/EgtB/PvdO family nonheme iron enzyme [Ardenticatenaceae bacterium]|nr:SUMF1/EgtB/PvdO family nonheme iron enzyme [Ardenticatenaceae bacterium]
MSILKKQTGRQTKHFVVVNFEAYQDGALSEQDKAFYQQHLAACQECQNWVDRQLNLIKQLRMDAAPQLNLSPVIADRIERNLYHRMRRTMTMNNLRSFAGVAISLAALVGIIGIYLWQNGSFDTPEQFEPLAPQSEIVEEVIDETSSLSLDELLNDNQERLADGMKMIFVAEGAFSMGREGGISGETPVHDVSLSGFWIDSNEVTNAQYALCVNDGSCGISQFADDPDFNGDAFPVVGVSWFNAANYCEWAGGRLPTEAEWEYTARGPEGVLYPWGDSFVGENANSCDTHCMSNRRDERNDDGYGRTAPVGNFPGGESWVGALDMSGNVSEWVYDWYDAEYYLNSSSLDPQGPESGDSKVVRGGAWSSSVSDLRSTTRAFANPDGVSNDVGFRCVITASN